MPLVVLLDASPQASNQVPLSWWCAAELAQWPSAAMTRDVFQFTVSQHLRKMSKEHQQEGSNVQCASTTADIIVDSSNNDNSSRVYLFLPFPQKVKAANKYFTTEIHLLCGLYINREDVYESNHHERNKQNTIFEEEKQKQHRKATCTESISNSNNSSSSSSYNDGNVFVKKWNEIIIKYNMYNINAQCQKLNVECMLHDTINMNNNDNSVGVVYLTSAAPHLRTQNVIWELFTHSSSALKAVMYFNQETSNDMNNSKTNNVSRWRDVCVNAEIELIVHECEEVHRYPEEYYRLADDSCQDKTNCNCAFNSSSSTQIKWESVNANVGKLGILSSPVTGTNRLMQLIAQTPWPEEQWEQQTNNNYTCEPIHNSNDNKVDIQKNKESEENHLPSRQNVFLVVSDSASAAINAFVSHECITENHTNKWTERFYTVKCRSANLTHKYKNKSCNRDNNINNVSELVLVNRYYAATVRTCCMHYYWFHPNMAAIRQKELISWTHTDGFALHAYVFATVDVYKELLQAEPLTYSTADMDSSSGWQPSLQYIVEELQSYNIDPIIVIDDDINDDDEHEFDDCGVTSNSNDNNYNSVEHKCVSKYNVEVILLKKSKNVTITTQLQQENLLWRETHGYDRLRETLHCVDWKYKLRRVSSYVIPHALYTGKEEQTHYINNNTKSVENSIPFINSNKVNSCLLSVFGKSAESEEEILYSLLSECFDIDFDSVLSQQGQCNNYKSIMSTVPSLLLHCMDEHTPEVRMVGPPPPSPHLSYEIANKYMTASVKLNVLGGICTRQGINLENASCVKFEEYDALLVCCTFKALTNAAAAAAAVYSTTSVNENNNQEVMSVLLCHAIQFLQQIAVKEFDEMANSYSDEEKELEELQLQTREQDASHLMGLFVIDVSVEDTVMVEKAMQLVTSIVTTRDKIDKKNRNTNDKQRSIEAFTREHKEKMSDELLLEESKECESSILFEVIFAEPKENENGKFQEELQEGSTKKEDVNMTHGMSRIREMINQHCWRVRKEASSLDLHGNEHVGANKKNVKAVEQEQCEETDSETCQSVKRNETKSNDYNDRSEEQSDTVERATCTLPPCYLVDPETLKSTPVRVLQYVQECHRCKPSAFNNSKNSNINDKSKKDNNKNVSYSHELQMWINKMNKYGHKLTKAQRQQQAAVLASALEYIDLC